MTELTLAWAALFFLRGAVYAVLIYLGKPGGLAAASLGLGWPAFGLLMFVELSLRAEAARAARRA